MRLIFFNEGMNSQIMLIIGWTKDRTLDRVIVSCIIP